MLAFFDIDTQVDFLYPAGALYGKGGERLIAPVAMLNRYAVQHKIPLISSTCAHPEESAEFREWPPHCIVGTVGQQKPAELLFAHRYVVPNKVAHLNPEGAAQIILEKDDLDLFTNPNLVRLLDQFEIDECIVYGAFTEYCVNCAVTGLLKSGRKVSLVIDAISALDQAQGEIVIDQFVKSGGSLINISAAASPDR